MRKLLFLFISAWALTALPGNAQDSFTTFPNDPLNLKKTVLENGLTVYLIEDHNQPIVFGGIAVKAGGKYDPADATGMAHYLEHMLFKGTTTLGTLDFEEEKKYLDNIDQLYEQLGQTSDSTKRREIQLKINENSVKATEYAIPNEFSNLINFMGGTGLNAFTTEDLIFFHNSFPSNQMQRWLDLYAHRMGKPVFRLFQSELETVYEEKNMRSESFQFALREALLQNAFKNHPYGTQSVIGTTEHLKSPSLIKMYEYFNTYFVANNMALILSGDFNADEVMPLVKARFADFRTGEVPAFPEYPEAPFKGRELVSLNISPIPMGVMGFRTVPKGHPDEIALEVTNYLLFNQARTGLFNQLSMDQKVLAALMLPYPVVDHGLSIVFFLPNTRKQSIEDAEKMVLEEIKRIHAGDFEDWKMEVARSQLKKDFLKGLEGLTSRAIQVGQTFAAGQSWEDVIAKSSAYDKVTREKIQEVASKYYDKNYFIIASNVGSAPKEKLNKPGYEAPVPKADAVSAYAKKFYALPEDKPTERFVDFEKDLDVLKMGDYVDLYAVKNHLNKIFELDIRFGFGTVNDPWLTPLAQYLSQVGSKSRTDSELARDLSRLGTTYNVSASDHYFTVSLEGYDDKLAESVAIIQELIAKPVADDSKVKLVAQGIMSNRQQELANPQVVGQALYAYAKYGDNSPWLTRPSIGKIQGKKAKEFLKLLKRVTSYAAEVHYSGTLESGKVKNILESSFFSKVKPKQATAYKSIPVLAPQAPAVYYLERKDANQTQMYFNKVLSKWNHESSIQADAFNRYFGQGFSALVLQEIREYRSLAYSAGASVEEPETKDDKMVFTGFLSTQTDKTNDAFDVMLDLIQNMPQKTNRMEMVRNSMLRNAYSSRPGFRGLSRWVVNQMRMGYSQDPNEQSLEAYRKLQWNDLYTFYQKQIQTKENPLVMAVTGDESRFDLSELEKVGKLIRLKETDVMTN